MTQVEELIKKQAAYVKESAAKLSAADHMEAAAKILRAEAAKPSNQNFSKAIKQDKISRFQKFSANIQAGYIKDLDSNMAADGWMCFHFSDKLGTRSYGRKDLPNHKVVVKGSTFSILNNGVVEVADVYLKNEKLQFQAPAKFIKKQAK